jgi:hypothetical protein
LPLTQHGVSPEQSDLALHWTHVVPLQWAVEPLHAVQLVPQ